MQARSCTVAPEANGLGIYAHGHVSRHFVA